MNVNITALENEIEMHKAIEANLTAQNSLQKGRKISVRLPCCLLIGYSERRTCSLLVFLDAFPHVTIETLVQKKQIQQDSFKNEFTLWMGLVNTM